MTFTFWIIVWLIGAGITAALGERFFDSDTDRMWGCYVFLWPLYILIAIIIFGVKLPYKATL
jgi:hypothetical protein